MTAASSVIRILGAFALGVVLTAAAVGIDLLGAGSLEQTALRLIVIATILFGLWRALGRTTLDRGTRLATWWTIALVLLIWQAVAWSLALAGVFRVGVGVPTLPLAFLLPVLVGLPILLRSRTLGVVLDATPPSWLIGLQVYRVFGSVFLVTWAAGGLPTVFALPAGIGDTLVGLLALPVAVYVQSGMPGWRRFGIGWNLLGLLDLITALTLGSLTAPGPFQRIIPDHVSTISAYPLVLIPAFAVPLSILLHAVSLRQLRRLGRPVETRTLDSVRLSPASSSA
jgi:hypothetical protein